MLGYLLHTVVSVIITPVMDYRDSANMTPGERKRQSAISELMDTEDKYMTDMHTAYDVSGGGSCKLHYSWENITGNLCISPAPSCFKLLSVV